MIEVFKTNVNTEEDAKSLLDQIHSSYPSYKANFDLDDCDHILRVEVNGDSVADFYLIQLLGSFGFYAETLPDTDASDDRVLKESKSMLNSFLLI